MVEKEEFKQRERKIRKNETLKMEFTGKEMNIRVRILKWWFEFDTIYCLGCNANHKIDFRIKKVQYSLAWLQIKKKKIIRILPVFYQLSRCLSLSKELKWRKFKRLHCYQNHFSFDMLYTIKSAVYIQHS